MNMHPLFAIGFELLSPTHILLLLVVGLLLFGKRLPEVGRSLGKGIVEFKKGLKGLEDDIDGGTSHSTDQRVPIEPPRPPQRIQAAAPKFEDNPVPPQA
jgi:sec-independent protein translocase protein TatA